MNRVYAALIHMSISFAIFVLLTYVVLFIWFPGFFFETDGGFEGMRILIGVDLVLGPILTFVVFKSGKPGLRFDLSVIGFVQLSCLLAGVYVIYTERPLFLVYYDKQFYSLSARAFTENGTTPPDPAKFDDEIPAHVYVAVPEDPIEEADLRRLLYKDSVPLWAYSPLYKPLDDHLDVVERERVSAPLIKGRDKDGKLDQWVSEKGEIDGFAFIPIHSRYRDVFVGINRETFEFEGLLDVQSPLSSAAL